MMTLNYDSDDEPLIRPKVCYDSDDEPLIRPKVCYDSDDDPLIKPKLCYDSDDEPLIRREANIAQFADLKKIESFSEQLSNCKMASVQELLNSHTCRDTAGIVIDYLIGDRNYWKGKNTVVLNEVPHKMDIIVRHNIRNIIKGQSDSDAIMQLQRDNETDFKMELYCDHYFWNKEVLHQFYFKWLLRVGCMNPIIARWVSELDMSENAMKRTFVKYIIDCMK
jgi:hypothetical protein